MTEFLEFVVPDVTAIDGLSEILREWSGESFSTDPPRYRYGRLAFTYLEGRIPYARVLPARFSELPGVLMLDDGLRESLRHNGVESEFLPDVLGFLRAIARASGEWAILYDRDDELELEQTQPALVTERFQELLPRMRSRSVALVVTEGIPTNNATKTARSRLISTSR